MVRTYSFLSLGEKCPYSELFWSAFFHIRTEYGETRSIFPYSVQMRENTDQNNSEYGHFSRSVNIANFEIYLNNIMFWVYSIISSFHLSLWKKSIAIS